MSEYVNNNSIIIVIAKRKRHSVEVADLPMVGGFFTYTIKCMRRAKKWCKMKETFIQIPLKVGWYILFGAVHELSHLVAASWWNCLNDYADDDDTTQIGDNNDMAALFYRTFLGRHTVIPTTCQDGNVPPAMLTHIGWITSLLLALLVHYHAHKNRQRDGTAAAVSFAANITLLEAIWTDLLGLPVLPGIFRSTTSTRMAAATTTLFCGNFGIILLHHSWFADKGKSPLDVLECMVKVRAGAFSRLVDKSCRQLEHRHSQPQKELVSCDSFSFLLLLLFCYSCILGNHDARRAVGWCG